MPLYTMLLDSAVFHGEIVPFLGETWSQRSFRAREDLWAALQSKAKIFAARYHVPVQDLLLCCDLGTLTFDRHSWLLLAGEALLVAATEIPEMDIAVDTLSCLMAPLALRSEWTGRGQFAPIQQALYGCRDLAFGAKLFRPEYVGYNDVEDVIRLADYLGGIDMTAWYPDRLLPLPGMADDGERQAELEDAREWFPLLADMYRRAANARQVIVAEIL